jgi:DNA-binding transcriptional MerR regulator
MTLAALVETDHNSDRIEKRPGAFRTISEVADDLGIPQHVLRFWEGRFAQIRPLKRAGGRRYYRPDDVDLLKGIQHLLHGQGYTIKGAQRVLKENGVRFVQAIGRGEAEAMVPPLQDRETESVGLPAGGYDETDALLQAVLDDLRACRAALASLEPGAD